MRAEPIRSALRIGALLALLQPLAPLHAADAPPAPVTAVTLHPGGATVTRTLAVAAGSGQAQARLTDSFDPATLRVSADGGIRIGQVSVQDSHPADSPNPAQAAIEDKIRDLEEEKAVLDAEIAAAETVKAYLDRLGAPAAPGEAARAPSDTKTLTGTIEVVNKSATDALNRRRVARSKKARIDRQIEALRRDLRQARGGAQAVRTLSIDTNAPHAGSLRVTYEVASAGWEPAYRAELDSANAKVRLVRLARISQKTGEDWKDVTLTLSTGGAQYTPTAPLPDPWLLTYVPPQRAALREAVAGARMRSNAPMASAPPPPPPPMPVSAADAMAPAAPPQESYVPPTFESEGAFETRFEVPGTVTLASDGRGISLELGRQDLAVHERIVVAPRLDASGTLTAWTERPEGVWPAGDLEVLRDGSYLGTSPWSPRESDRLDFSFGHDELVHVKVEHAKDGQGDKGLLDRRRERRIDDVYTITNRHLGPIDVLVLEASPVAVSDEVNVEASFDPRPGSESWDGRRGVKAWERTLPPRESMRVGVKYTISHPREGSVPGVD